MRSRCDESRFFFERTLEKEWTIFNLLGVYFRIRKSSIAVERSREPKPLRRMNS